MTEACRYPDPGVVLMRHRSRTTWLAALLASAAWACATPHAPGPAAEPDDPAQAPAAAPVAEPEAQPEGAEADVEASEADRSLPDPGYLPPTARALLADQMANHAVEALSLAWEVSLLEYDQVADIAERMATAPRIARPLPGATDELNVRLPAAFFDYQDALRAHARALAGAASRGDADAMAEAYGQLARTCVQCHAVYLEPPAEDLD
jgi:hypothetical protein